MKELVRPGRAMHRMPVMRQIPARYASDATEFMLLRPINYKIVPEMPRMTPTTVVNNKTVLLSLFRRDREMVEQVLLGLRVNGSNL